MALLPEHLPGEKLLIRIWVSLERLSVGLASPLQIRREGLARNDIRRREMLLDAQTLRDIEEVKAGLANVDAVGNLVRIQDSNVGDRREPYLMTPPNSPLQLIEFVRTRADLENLGRLLNLRRVAHYAEDEARSAAEPSEAVSEPTTDWLSNWRDGAQAVSTEEMQRLWAKVLVGEVTKPGAFCLRTLHLLRTLTKDEADLISKIGPFVFGTGFIIKILGGKFENEISFDQLLSLEEMGIISGVQGVGLNRQQSFQSVTLNSEQKLVSPIICHRKRVILVIRIPSSPNEVYEFPIYGITRVGRELLSLGEFIPDEDYVSAAAYSLINPGHTEVQIADFVPSADGKGGTPRNLTPINLRPIEMA